MKHIIICNTDISGIVSPENDLTIGRQYLLELISPVHLKLSVCLKIFKLHKSLDVRTQIPASRRDLITAQVDIRRIFEESINLTNHILSQCKYLRLRQIELTIVSCSSSTLDCDVLGFPVRS